MVIFYLIPKKVPHECSENSTWNVTQTDPSFIVIDEKNRVIFTFLSQFLEPMHLCLTNDT